MITTTKDLQQARKIGRNKGATLGVSDALGQMSGFGMPQIDQYPDYAQEAFMAGVQESLPAQPVNTGPVTPSIAYNRFSAPKEPESIDQKKAELQKMSRAASLGSALGTIGMNFSNLGYNPPALEPLSSPINADITKLDDDYLKAMEKYQEVLRGTEMANVNLGNQEMLENTKLKIAAEKDAEAKKAMEAQLKKDEQRYQEEKAFRDKEFNSREGARKAQESLAREELRLKREMSLSSGKPKDDFFAAYNVNKELQELTEKLSQAYNTGDQGAIESLKMQIAEKSKVNASGDLNSSENARNAKLGKERFWKEQATDAFNRYNFNDPSERESMITQILGAHQRAFPPQNDSEVVTRKMIEAYIASEIEDRNQSDGAIETEEDTTTQPISTTQPNDAAQRIIQRNAMNANNGIKNALSKLVIPSDDITKISTIPDSNAKIVALISSLENLIQSSKNPTDQLNQNRRRTIEFYKNYLSNPNTTNNLDLPAILK